MLSWKFVNVKELGSFCRFGKQYSVSRELQASAGPHLSFFICNLHVSDSIFTLFIYWIFLVLFNALNRSVASIHANPKKIDILHAMACHAIPKTLHATFIRVYISMVFRNYFKRLLNKHLIFVNIPVLNALFSAEAICLALFNAFSVYEFRMDDSLSICL